LAEPGSNGILGGRCRRRTSRSCGGSSNTGNKETGGWGRDIFDDQCEAVFSASWFPEADHYRVGADALRAWTGFTDAFETFEVRLNRIIDAGDQVVALTQLRARGQASGAAVDALTGASSHCEAARSFGMC
jgi:hypothetical protein